MIIPSFEELNEKRKARKKNFKALLNGDKSYKLIIQEQERLVKNYILNNYHKLEKVDQDILGYNSKSSAMTLALGFTPFIALGSYTIYMKPNFSIRQKILFWLPSIIIFPSLAICNSMFNTKYIQLYLLEKYIEKGIGDIEEKLSSN